MQYSWSHLLMMDRGVMFAVIVSKISGTGAPINKKFPLVLPILNPVEAHVYSLRHFLLDSLVGKANSCGIIYYKGCRYLWMAHFFQAYTYREHFPGINIPCPYFSLSCGAHHIFYYFTDDMDGTVDGGIR